MVMRAHLKRTETSERVLEYLATTGPHTMKEIIEALPDIDATDINYTLKRLNGWRVKTERIKNRRKKQWRFIR